MSLGKRFTDNDFSRDYSVVYRDINNVLIIHPLVVFICITYIPH